ncbi:hypothetical protein HRbin15_01912 [bacterium HR15]|nr:hypothetical protein HRbin15_01912 [bacterium HR15]
MIAETVRRLRVGEAISRHNLTVIPLLDDQPAKPSYLLMSDALKQGLLTIEEVSVGGSVNTIKATNRATLPVLLPDSEELVGAKQNRVLNVSILVPAQTSLHIPVSCVEAGRWSYRRERFHRMQEAIRLRTQARQAREGVTSPEAGFEPSDYMLHHQARARKAQQVHALRRMSGSPQASQGDIWHEVDRLAAEARVFSPTSAMHDVYEYHHARLERYLEGMEPSEKQVGALFALNGQIVGLELFDAPDTFRKMFPKILRSYAIGALWGSELKSPAPDSSEAEQFLEAVAKASAEPFQAVGQGVDVHLSGETLTGAALLDGERLIHLYAFRTH